jgi:ubiquinone biosynthesis accessory factor UbiJ
MPASGFLPNDVLLRIANHLLAGQPWLRDRLVAHAGSIVSVETFPFQLTVAIAVDGSLIASRDASAPNAQIALSPVVLARLLAGDAHARADVRVTGDPALAEALGQVALALRWDAEEDLSRLLGDIAAHRIVQGARALAAWQVEAVQGVAASIGEYLVEERGVLARKDDVERWSQDVEALRDAVERLEKRVEAATDPRPAAD